MAELEIIPTPRARGRVIALIALSGLITGVLVFLLTGGGRNLFERKSNIYTFMPDVSGLAVKSDVRLSGISIGSVTKIEITQSLDPQHAVRIDMRVNSRFLKNIPSDSDTTIGEDTLIGYQFVSIEEGKSPVPLAAQGTLRTKPPSELNVQADFVHALQSELSDLDALLAEVTSGETPTGRFVMGEKEYDQLLRQLSSFDSSIHAVLGPQSGVAQALFSNDLYTQLRDPLLRVDNAMAAIQRGEGAGGKLFASDDQYNAWVRSLQDLHATLADANAGKGSFGALLHDDAQYRKVQKLLAETDATLASLNAGNGQVGRLLKDPQLYESLNGSLRDMAAFLADLHAHPQKYLRYKVF